MMHSHFVFVCISQHGSAVSVGKVVVGCMLYYNNKWHATSVHGERSTNKAFNKKGGTGQYAELTLLPHERVYSSSRCPHLLSSVILII